MLWELAKHLGGSIPDTWNKYLFRRFWGEGALSRESYLVLENYQDVGLRHSLRFVRDLPRQANPQDLIDAEITYGKLSPNAAAMLSALFLRHTGKLLRIATDTEVEQTMDATLICYGNSDSNLKTFDIEESSGNALFQFVFDGAGQRAFQICEQLYSAENRSGVAYDKAILLRLNNPQNPNHCYVVCAGLSEWGSLAAVYYLTKKWKVLHKRFDRFWRRRDFCVLLEVQSGQFENATEVASVVRLSPLLQG
jgi:hypothetical protein